MIRLFCALILLLVFPSFSRSKEDRPNILLIFADDLGWSDLACYGGDRFFTPHLDQLASEGIRFTEAYAAAPICSASRAALLTGNSTARNGFEFVVKEAPGKQDFRVPLQSPPFTLDLALESTTIPEMLAPKGYATAFFGKWHLNTHHKRYLGWSPTHGPHGQGFQSAEEDFGSHPYSYWKDKALRSFDDAVENGIFPEDGMTRRAIEFLSQEHDKPFFLMVSHFFVHDPNHTRLRWLHDQYIDQLPADTRNREKVAHYGAMVTTLDHHVGQLLAALEDSGHLDSTLVVFTSDNGGHPNYAGNAPLRGSKWNLYEGGIRVPFLVRWPGVAPEGAVCSEVVWSPDLAPTFAEIAGASNESAHDGRSLTDLIRNPDSELEERSLYWHFPYYHPEKNYQDRIDAIGINDGETSKTRPHSAIRKGDWKLLHFYEDDRNELYHIQNDLSESRDLASAEPEKTEALRTDLLKYLHRVQARFPTPRASSRK
ncbi:MAG: sulfatase [Verrucomicrobiales bacterium]|nr:sulfatase [Verrucomicrobiales bacterium]